MAYYRGDYYVGRGARGDYYRGDPFWGALWTGIKTVGGALLGTLRTGAAAQQQQAQVAGGLSGVQAAASPNYMQQPGMEIARRDPVGASGVTRMPMVRRAAQATGLMPSHQVDPMTGAVMPRRRRMNPANPRALRRSIRRVVGFGKLAMRSRRAVSKAATAIGCNTGRRSYRAPRRRAS